MPEIEKGKIKGREPEKDTGNAYERTFLTEDELRKQTQTRLQRERAAAAARPPKPEKQQKWENFWFHNKTAVLFVAILTVLVGLTAWELFNKANPDVNIILVSARFLPDETLSEIAAALEEQITDLNGDGEVFVALNYVPYLPDEVDTDGAVPADQILGNDGGQPGLALEQGALQDAVLVESDYANTMKLTTIIASGEHPLFLLDEENYQNLMRVSRLNDPDFQLFRTLADIPGSVDDALPFVVAAPALTEEIPLLDTLHFYYRNLSVGDKNADYMANCYEFLRQIAE